MITVVSGLPRSGTSLMMQMLNAGGLPILTDGVRQSDLDNPRGYLEWEGTKLLHQRPGCIAEAEGKVVKIISPLLFALPADRTYRVIFMSRALREVIRSQSEMIRRRGASGPALPEPAMIEALEVSMKQTTAWLRQRPSIKVLMVDYHNLLHYPSVETRRVEVFLGTPLNIEAMLQQVDLSLYRQREDSGSFSRRSLGDQPI